MVLIYKCPNCGANMRFDSEKQQLFCDHCGTEKRVEEVEQEEQREEHQEKAKKEDSFQKNDFKMFQCPTCGAEILTDENTAATFCTYCGNSALIESRLMGVLAPSRVIPFKISKEQAKSSYLKWAKKGLLTPASFVSQSTIEKITGMYVPFWMYDYNADVSLQAECTRVRTERHGDTEYIHTDHYHVFRDFDADYKQVPADASIKMEDSVMDQLEPFQCEELKDFEMPYLSGFLAEKFNYDSNELTDRVKSRIRNFASQVGRETIGGYATVNIMQEEIGLEERKAEYVMFPVWMLNYRYLGKDYLFTLNAQTGKIVGKLPVSKGKCAAWFLGISLLSFLVIDIIARFL